MLQSAFKKSRLSWMLASAVALSACSSAPERVEPPMSPIESAYQLNLQWQYDQGRLDKNDADGLTFAESTDFIYVADNNGKVTALKKSNQSRWVDQVQWQTEFADKVISGPVLDGNRVLVGTSKGKFKALDAQNGALLWQTSLSSEVIAAPTLVDDKIYTRTIDGKVYALDRDSGKIIWASEHQMPKLSFRGAPPVLSNGEMVFVGWETGIVQALKAQSGELIWEARIATPSGRTDLERMVDVQASLVLQGDRLYAMGYHGNFAAINIKSGNFIYVNEVSGFRDFVVTDKNIFLVDDEDIIRAYDASNGTPIWRQESMKGRAINDLQMDGEALLVADDWGYLHWFNPLQGNEFARVKHSNEYGDGERIVRIQVASPYLYLMDDTGSVARYKREQSDLFQFRESLK